MEIIVSHVWKQKQLKLFNLRLLSTCKEKRGKKREEKCGDFTMLMRKTGTGEHKSSFKCYYHYLYLIINAFHILHFKGPIRDGHPWGRKREGSH